MVIRHWLASGCIACFLLYSCTKDNKTEESHEVFMPGSSKFIGVKVSTYTDTTGALIVYSNQALVNEDSNRSMVFTGSSQAVSYVDGASVANTLWADSLEADLDNKRLNASGNCLLVNVEGDSFTTSKIFFTSDSLSSFQPTKAVFGPRSERNIVLEPGEHLLDSFVYTSSKTLLWKQ